MQKKEYVIYDVEAEMYNCNYHYPNCIAFKLSWTANIGFGEISYVYDTQTKQWTYDTECMGKEFCIEVLNKWLDNIVAKPLKNL